MLTQLFDWFGNLSGFGVDPFLVSCFGFCIFLFCVSEFFRLLELIIVHLTRR